MKLRPFTRIIVEDFKQEEQGLINRLANALNPSLEQMNTVLTKNLDFENLNQEIIKFDVTVDSTGKPSIDTIAHALKGRPSGLIVIKALASDSGIYPTGAPFVSFTFDGSDFSKIKLTNITGLPAGKKFNLSCLVIV